jgi:hypothetical protein
MTIALATAGGIFTRWGREFAEIQDINSLRGGTTTSRVTSGASLKTRVTNMVADYAASVANPELLSKIYANLSAKQAAIGAHLTPWYVGTGVYNPILGNTDIPYIANLIIKMAQDDNPVNPAYTTQSAIAELIRQMIAASATIVNGTTAAGSQTAVGSPNGSAYIFQCGVLDSRGKSLDYAFAETVTAICTADSQGTATKFEEQFRIYGQPALADTMSHLWPQGSGSSVTVQSVDPYSSFNLLYNSNPDTFTSHVPNGWTLAVGTGGSAGGVQDAVADGGFAAYFGSHALQFLGDGATLTTIRQQFNSGLNTHPLYSYANGLTPPYTWGGGPGAAAAQGNNNSPQYGVSFWLKFDSVPAAGVLQVALVDNNFSVINDDTGTANSASITLSGTTTSYVNYNYAFRLPLILPTSMYFQLKATTAISNSKNLILGGICMAPLTQMYPGGPAVGMWSGNTAAYLTDSWTRAITNTYGALGQYLERTLGLRAMGLRIPSANSGSETVHDSLVA